MPIAIFLGMVMDQPQGCGAWLLHEAKQHGAKMAPESEMCLLNQEWTIKVASIQFFLNKPVHVHGVNVS